MIFKVTNVHIKLGGFVSFTGKKNFFFFLVPLLQDSFYELGCSQGLENSGADGVGYSG